jgi:hypothetical protein
LDGALGVMLVSLGIAEIGQNAVAYVLGDKTLDQLRAASASAI